MTKANIHYKSIFTNEQELLNAILILHNDSNDIELDPPFMYGIHGKTLQKNCAKRYTMYKNKNALKSSYNSLLDEVSRILRKDGLLIFKCQDYTDDKTFMTHCFVYNLAVSKGFYAKDLVLLNKENKIYNANLNQRHFRKTHCYFWIFVKQ